MSDTDEQSGVLFDGTYQQEYRRLRTLSSRTDIRQVSVSEMAWQEQTNKSINFCIINNEQWNLFKLSFILIFQFSQSKSSRKCHESA